jgi:hypothetical protein
MADRHALFDRDVFLKLVACNLWAECLDALGITHPYRLASASVRGAKTPLNRWRPPDALRADILQRIEALQGTVPVIPNSWIQDSVQNPLYNAMLAPEQEGIDQGEAQLAVVALSTPAVDVLVSGDKRFIQALRFRYPDVFRQLRESLICFEDCLRAIIERLGLDAIRDRLIVAKGCDSTLNIALGNENHASQDDFLAALSSYNPLFP